ncbi:hypothetical protein LQQ69_26515 (plasmid) [Escherichia coli]|nr:hypothetical protein LQQ69_26515 [Escherichia coli]
MAIPLAHLDGRYDGRIVGWQRIDKQGGKYQTSAVTSGDFVGACFVIGELKGAQTSLLQKVLLLVHPSGLPRKKINALTLWLSLYPLTTWFMLWNNW